MNKYITEGWKWKRRGKKVFREHDGENKEGWRNDRRRKYYGGNGRRERKNEGIEWAEVARTGRLQPPWLPPH